MKQPSYRVWLTWLALLTAVPAIAEAQDGGMVRGRILDPLGAPVPTASVELLQGGDPVSASRDSPKGSPVHVDANGRYELLAPGSGDFRIRAQAPSFETVVSEAWFVGSGATITKDVTIPVGTLSQVTVVTDTGTPAPEAQATSSVDVLNLAAFQNRVDVQDVLRLLPGVQLTQTGQRGGITSLFVRGGTSDANKVMIDGIPANDIGGSFDFADLPLASFDKVELYRGPNSVLYGTDALASVVDLTSRRGTSSLPELQYAVDGGNFGSRRQEGSLGQLYGRFDYFADFTRLDTNNSLPHSGFSESTVAANLGWHIDPKTSLRGTLRRIVADQSLSNALDLYGIPDNEIQHNQHTYVSVTLENQTTKNWHNLLRYGATRFDSQFEQPSAAGLPADPFGFGAATETLGLPVTLRGANGYSASGQATYHYLGTYPSFYDTQSNQDFAYFDSRYDYASYLTGLFGFRYARERGDSLSLPYVSTTAADRSNFSYTGQISGNVRSRFFYTAGVGVDDNAVFGLAASPRVSAGYYMNRPNGQTLLSGTKIRFTYGRGIKEPLIYQQTGSLYALLNTLPNGGKLIAQHNVAPIGPERSTTFDAGLEQYAFSSRLLLTATFFHNQFSNQVEYVSGRVLPQLGVPQDVAITIENTSYGAYVNSLKYRALGTEVEVEAHISNRLTARGGWTYLDPVVQRSFSSNALKPAINRLYPGVAIGQYSPLIGARPFRQAPHTGFLSLIYSRSRYNFAFTGTLVGRRDDSTFLTDEYGGTTLLLPNRNLDAAYQDFGFTGSYKLTRFMSLYGTADNLLSQHYHEAFGYPATPFSFRVGMRFTIGGESWKGL